MQRYREAVSKSKKLLLNLPNVVGVGIGKKRVGSRSTDSLAIVILVKKKLDRRQLPVEHLIPGQIDGLNTDVIEVGEVRFLDLENEQNTAGENNDDNIDRTKKMRPARPGTSIGHYRVSAGTFGALVKDKRTGARMILSNNHVLANATDGQDGKSQIGDLILQPGTYDGGTIEDQIAVLERFVPIQKGAGEPTCPIAQFVARFFNILLHLVRPSYQMNFVKRQETANKVDCALARPVSEDLVAAIVLRIGEVKGVRPAVINQAIQKSGRTSGYSTGEVLAVGVSINVQISAGEYAFFEDQIISNLTSQPGDSGSLVLDMENNAVGLLFAGSDQVTVINTIQNVLDFLEIEF